MDWAFPGSATLWQAAWAALPVTILIAVLCRVLPCRPATRHTLWLTALLAFVVPLVLPELPHVQRLVDRDEATPAIVAMPDADAVAVSRPASPPSPPAAPQPTAFEAEPASGPRAPFFSLSPEVATESAPTAARAGATQRPTAHAHAATPPKPAPAAAAPIATHGSNRHSRPDPQRPHRSSEPRRTHAASPPAPPVEPARQPRRDPPPAATALAPSPAPPAETFPVLAAARLHLRSAVLAVREAIRLVPTVPGPIWLAGAALLLLVQLGRMAAFRRRLRCATPAAAATIRNVADVARALGVRRVPRTLMVRERVSPLIWCGSTPTLILPESLWSQLDRPAQRAILAHELAHLKRRDHWVCWAELLISAMYWWHPLVWWIRRRLAEEADLSCDAWVTWLMPHRRRAYAEALLKTRQYVGQSCAAPAGGLSVTTVGARRLARRLTMVMTTNGRPRTSMVGVLLATTTAAVGWIAHPALSCPPEEKAAGKTRLAKAGAAEAACEAKCDPSAAPSGATRSARDATAYAVTLAPSGVAVAPLDGTVQSWMVPADAQAFLSAPVAVDLGAQPLATTYQAYVDALAGATDPAIAPWIGAYFLGDEAANATTCKNTLSDAEQADLAERLRKLEAELKRLSEQMGRLHGQQPAVSLWSTTPVPPVAAPPPAPPAAPAAPAPSVAPRGGVSRSTPAQRSVTPFALNLSAADNDGAIVVRSYKLPKGKLQALTALMIRDDVPIRVRAAGDGIEVHATPRQHEIFSAFLRIIHPDAAASEAARTAPSTPRPPKAPKPPRPPKPGTKSKSDGQESTQLIEALSLAERALSAKDMQKSLAAIQELLAARGQDSSALAESLRLRELDAATRRQATSTIEALVETLRSSAAERASIRDGIESEVEALWRQAEELADAAEITSAQAEEIARQLAKRLDKDVARKLETHSRTLEQQARDLERRVRAIEARARALERQADAAEIDADRFDEQADQLDDILESLDDVDEDDAPDSDVEVIELPEELEAIAPPPTPGVAAPAPPSAASCAPAAGASPTPTQPVGPAPRD